MFRVWEVPLGVPQYMIDSVKAPKGTMGSNIYCNNMLIKSLKVSRDSIWVLEVCGEALCSNITPSRYYSSRLITRVQNFFGASFQKIKLHFWFSIMGSLFSFPFLMHGFSSCSSCFSTFPLSLQLINTPSNSCSWFFRPSSASFSSSLYLLYFTSLHPKIPNSHQLSSI